MTREDAREKLTALIKAKETTEEWTPREKKLVYKYLVLNGTPVTSEGSYEWDKFKQEANLHKKTPESIKTYYLEYVKDCLEMAKATDDTSSPKDLNDDSDLFTVQKCKKLITRLMLFSQLRTKLLVMTSQELEQVFSKLPKTADLPPWWDSHKFDFGLLMALHRYGLGRREEICKDKSLPFYLLYKELYLNSIWNQQSDDGMPIADKILFPKESVLCRRLEMMVTEAKRESRKSPNRPALQPLVPSRMSAPLQQQLANFQNTNTYQGKKPKNEFNIIQVVPLPVSNSNSVPQREKPKKIEVISLD